MSFVLVQCEFPVLSLLHGIGYLCHRPHKIARSPLNCGRSNVETVSFELTALQETHPTPNDQQMRHAHL
jgi:hypothetical protein